jgi:hypothetical protein
MAWIEKESPKHVENKSKSADKDLEDPKRVCTIEPPVLVTLVACQLPCHVQPFDR